MKVLHVVGALNNWALHQRAKAIIRAMSDKVDGEVVSYQNLKPGSLAGVDFIHIHGVQLVFSALTLLGKCRSCRWGFEVVSERSLKHLESHMPLCKSGILQRASCCWVKNPRLAEFIQPHIKCEPVYVPNGVDPSIFNPGPIRVGWVGNKRPSVVVYKGLPLILLAVRLLKKRLPNGCVFLDDPSNYPKVAPQSQLAEYYRKLDVFVSASIAEGSSNVVNEALACGVPVVSTRTGMAEELAADGLPVILVDRNSESIAEGILKAVRHKLTCAKIMADEYGWAAPSISDIYLKSYSGAL